MDDLFSDSDGEKAVEELLSQAMDSTVLDQLAAINCAGFTDHGLPSNLETRFQKLKSFPSSAPAKPINFPAKSFPLQPNSINEAKNQDSGEENGGDEVRTRCLKKCPDEKNCSFDSGSLSPVKKMEKKGSRLSPSSYEGFSSRSVSVSPPAKSGCFLCSPKKVSSSSRKKGRGGRGLDWGSKRDDGLLSDLSNFSMSSSERKLIKKAMEEEERICREAEKIVKWAKQASARMDVSGIEDELMSDDENAKFH